MKLCNLSLAFCFRFNYLMSENMEQAVDLLAAKIAQTALALLKIVSTVASLDSKRRCVMSHDLLFLLVVTICVYDHTRPESLVCQQWRKGEHGRRKETNTSDNGSLWHLFSIIWLASTTRNAHSDSLRAVYINPVKIECDHSVFEFRSGLISQFSNQM